MKISSYLCGMKTIFNTVITIFLLYAFCEYVKDLKKNEVGVSDEKRTTDVEPYVNNTLIIRGLGNVDRSDLEYASKIVEDFYGYSCIIKENVDIPDNIYYNSNTIDAPKCIDEFNSSVKTLYITEKNIEENETDLRGYTTLYGNTIVVKGKKSIMKETIVHEIGHTLGLYHCDDLTCVMAINNDEYDSGDFCNNCKNKLNK